MLETAKEAAYQAGKMLFQNFGVTTRDVREATQHDIKLELDERAESVIADILLSDFPDSMVLGEESSRGKKQADVRWVVDPLDGTVNFFYGIPHFCVSVAAQVREKDEWKTVAGVVFDPVRDEMFAADGKSATLNDAPIRVSERKNIDEAIVAMGFFKTKETIEQSLGHFSELIHKVRKIRLMGAAALDCVYVACGRYDAYIEYGIKLWDIAAGQLILENAGGKVVSKPTATPNAFDVCMWNGALSLADLQGTSK
jgi:myo-inositol-1(or 4)-monophosphatase